jgi:hypothetical protein
MPVTRAQLDTLITNLTNTVVAAVGIIHAQSATIAQMQAGQGGLTSADEDVAKGALEGLTTQLANAVASVQTPAPTTPPTQPPSTGGGEV